nr:GNAT family N-acetyltransferase [Actinoplanes maris]
MTWPPDPRAWLATVDAAWVAESASIVGHVAVRDGDPAELCRLFVVPAARRGDVGRLLIDQARGWAAERGCGLTLNVVDEQRSAAIAFYEATGWRFTHVSQADWTGPDGRPVRLRHYEAG